MKSRKFPIPFRKKGPKKVPNTSEIQEEEGFQDRIGALGLSDTEENKESNTDLESDTSA
jgi:hypothetical protein